MPPIFAGFGSSQLRTFGLLNRSNLPAVQAQYLIIGGGGAGAVVSSPGGGGGGGAGGFLINDTTGYPFIVGVPYTVTVGGGGTAASPNRTGSNGVNSSISSSGTDLLIAFGGGRGGRGDDGAGVTYAAYGIAPVSPGGYANLLGPPFGSGGGTGRSPFSRPRGPGYRDEGIGTPGQGFDSGVGDSDSAPVYYGGGGGGAAQDGQGGNGGQGKYTPFSGANTAYAGGGGAAGPRSPTSPGTGGAGGGGAAGQPGQPGVAGTNNTGGGGGAVGTGGPSGGNGGSGIIFIRYNNQLPDLTTTTGSPTKTDDGTYKIYKWTGSGSFTF